jgi:hypothetical protein
MFSTTIFYQKNIRWASSPTIPRLVFRRSCFRPFCVSSVLRFIHFVFRLSLPSCTSRWIFLPSFQVDFVFFVVRSRHCHRRRDDSDPIAVKQRTLFRNHIHQEFRSRTESADWSVKKKKKKCALLYKLQERDKIIVVSVDIIFSPRIINLASAVVVCLVFKFCPRGQNCPFCP